MDTTALVMAEKPPFEAAMEDLDDGIRAVEAALAGKFDTHIAARAPLWKGEAELLFSQGRLWYVGGGARLLLLDTPEPVKLAAVHALPVLARTLAGRIIRA